MASPGPLGRLARRVPPLAGGAAVIAAAWGVATWVPYLFFNVLVFWGQARGWFDGVEGTPVRDAAFEALQNLQITLPLFAFGLTVAIPLAMLLRMVARARLRAGLPDPLDRARSFAAAHPRATSLLTAGPALLWTVVVLGQAIADAVHWGGYSMYGHLAGTAAIEHLRAIHAAWTLGLGAIFTSGAVKVYLASRPAVRAFLAPVEIREADAASPTSERRVGFDAVAVTTETRAAVAAMAVLPVLTFFAMNALKLGDTGTEVALAAYVGVALGGAVAFRRASRIALGVDGIFVTGSSRSRFFAFRDIEGVRTRGTDIELLRKGRVVLRLQLHGQDATRKDEIVARIDEAVVAAGARRTAPVAEIVASSSEEGLARLAEGPLGYRSASVTREQLWSLVRAPEPDAKVRTAAARALVESGGGDDRAKLRVAARECAEPELQGELRSIAGEDDDDADVGPRAKRATR